MGSGASNANQFSSAVYENSSTFQNSRFQDPALEATARYSTHPNVQNQPVKVPPSILLLQEELRNRNRRVGKGCAAFDQFFEMHSLQMFT